MSVVLFYPPNYFKDDATKRDYGQLPERWAKVPPLGILYLASVLEERGIHVNVIDANAMEIGLKESIELIKKYNPCIVGISATSYQIRGAYQLAEKLREEYGKEITIGLGGPHISADPNFINRFPLFNFGVVGDGEITFSKIVEDVINGKKVRKIYYGELPTSLDVLPFPARHLIDKKFYFSPGHEYATIIASRGCPYNCIFCSIKGLRKRTIRFRSPKNIVDEMEFVKDKYNIKNFWFIDDAFTTNRRHTVKLCKEIIDRKIDVKWWCETRVDSVDEDLLKIMKNSGCMDISFGIESGSERVRINIIRKNFTNEQAFRIFSLCKKIHIHTEAYLMLGFPTETLDEMYQTANFGVKIGADIIGIHITQLMPGSDLFALAIKEGAVSKDIYDSYVRGELKGHLPVYIPKGLSLNHMLKVQKYGYQKFYFRPKFLLRRLVYDLSSLSRLKEDIHTVLTLFMRGKPSGEPV